MRTIAFLFLALLTTFGVKSERNLIVVEDDEVSITA
jgi:hypothetical protein